MEEISLLSFKISNILGVYYTKTFCFSNFTLASTYFASATSHSASNQVARRQFPQQSISQLPPLPLTTSAVAQHPVRMGVPKREKEQEIEKEKRKLMECAKYQMEAFHCLKLDGDLLTIPHEEEDFVNHENRGDQLGESHEDQWVESHGGRAPLISLEDQKDMNLDCPVLSIRRNLSDSVDRRAVSFSHCDYPLDQTVVWNHECTYPSIREQEGEKTEEDWEASWG
jgi:hypothetical protein